MPDAVSGYVVVSPPLPRCSRVSQHLVRNPSHAVDLSVEALKYFAVLLVGIGFMVYGVGLTVLAVAYVLFWLVVYAGRNAPVFVDSGYPSDSLEESVRARASGSCALGLPHI